ncbi:S-layer family protein [Trichocoleus sp. Lan]|uniref:S-layer family protein n=1 Tax=Trichocoleus sp. Lan TaxID=2933927 RepID=UPI0032979C16
MQNGTLFWEAIAFFILTDVWIRFYSGKWLNPTQLWGLCMKLRSLSFWLFGSLSGFCLVTTSPMQAQIVEDSTLPQPSIVTQSGNSRIITGGTQANSNLFHSFEEFSIPTNGSAYFNNAANIQNIISRVTGSSESKIDGLIRANGTANLFLINPNGITFGSNAALKIGGSFLASTATSLSLADGTSFSATNPQTTPLLTASVPIGLQFGKPAASIQVQGAKLQVPSGKTLGLVGGNLTLVGGRLQAAGGRIELGSVAGASTPTSPAQVNLTPTAQGYALGYPNIQNFQDIQSQQTTVTTSGNGGGDIHVQGRRIALTEGSQMLANTLGSAPGGTLAVTGSELVDISGSSPSGDRSGLFARVNSKTATGSGGNLTVETGKFIVRDGAQVSTSTFGQGQGGNLTVRATDSVEVSGRSSDREIGSGLRATVQGGAKGDGGNLTVETGQLIVRDGAEVTTSTFGQGKAGDLTVRATQVEAMGYGFDENNTLRQSSLRAQVEQNATGTGGNLTIESDRLSVQNGAQVAVTTLSKFSQAKAGTLTVRASDVELAGVAVSADGQLLTNQLGLPFPSGLFSGSGIGSQADGGALSVETERLRVRDGAVIQTSTLGAGDAGNLTVQASEFVELAGTAKGSQFPSSLLAVSGGIPGFPGVFDATGRGGSLRVNTGKLTLRDGAAVAASSFNPANDAKGAGNLELTAQSLSLDNQATITAATASGNGGNMVLVQDLLLLRHNSRISSTAGIAGAGGNGGNITINSSFIVAVPGENSDITANAFTGNGGNIQITTQGIFGIQFREDETLLSDITASSEFGVNGVVEINTPDVDPSRGVVALPTDLVDASGLIASSCGTTVGQQKSELVVTGRGGIPPNPGETLSSVTVWSDLRLRTQQVGNLPNPAVVPSHPATGQTTEQLMEAQGWVRNNFGEVILTARSPTGMPHATSCAGS